MALNQYSKASQLLAFPSPIYHLTSFLSTSISLPSTMIFKSIFISLAALIPLVSVSEASVTGFTIDLIHRDLSPQSPFYNPSLSPSQRIANAGGQYLMEYSVGTPPTPSLGIIDTGSDLIWTQCKPCTGCFDQSLPLFEPINSPTYRKVRCNTTTCNLLQEITFCSADKRNCLYSFFNPAFNVSSSGEFAFDAFTLVSPGESLSLPRLKFGCGFENSALSPAGESGVVGLGAGKGSLIRQLGSLIGGRFSYCLAPLSDKSNLSKLSFGSEAEVSGDGAVSTPLVTKEGDSFYYLTMEGITAGDQRMGISSDSGNTILHVGRPVTLLPADIYLAVVSAIKSSIKLDETADPERLLDLCYLTKEDREHVPQVTVHFEGADVKLKYENVFVRRSDVIVCFAVLPTTGGVIYGNLAQANFQVGYDIDKGIVSFKSTDCAK